MTDTDKIEASPTDTENVNQKSNKNGELNRDSANFPKIPLYKRSVYIGNIPHETTEKDLEPFFKEFGTIEGIKIPLNANGTPKGHAFIQYLSQGQALKAVNELKEIELHGKICPVRMASIPNQDKQRKPNQRESSQRERNSYDRSSNDYPPKEREYQQRDQRPLPPPLPPQAIQQQSSLYDPRFPDRRLPLPPVSSQLRPPLPPPFPDRRFLDPRALNMIREEEARKRLLQQIERDRMIQR